MREKRREKVTVSNSFEVVVWEGEKAHSQSIQNDSQGPDVDGGEVLVLLGDQLRRHVVGRAAILEDISSFLIAFVGESEVD